MNSGGVKNDAGKPAMQFLTREFLEGTAMAQGFGAAKYGDWNFTKGIQYTRLQAAIMRHLTAFASRENNDPESGLSHLAHAAAGLNMLMWMVNNRSDLDDRIPNVLNEDHLLDAVVSYYKGM